MQVVELIAAIQTAVQREGMPPPRRTRLTKLLYLTEVEYFRATGQRLTDLAWFFHHYGPYAHELAGLLGGEELGAAGDEARIYPANRATEAVRDDVVLRGLLEAMVHEWGDADLNRLLDYVYFETEPMDEVRRGDRLDFSTVRPRTPARAAIRLDRAQLHGLRARVAAAATQYRDPRERQPATELLLAGLRAWDDDGSARLARAAGEPEPSEPR